MVKDRLFKFVILLSAFLLTGITALTLFRRTPGMFNLPFYFIIILVLLIFFIIAGCRYFLHIKMKISISGPFFTALLVIFTALPRLLWILLVTTTPVSDFAHYQDYAVNASKGLFNSYFYFFPIFPFKFAYPLILSVLYRIFGVDILAAKLFNVILSVSTALLIYRIGARVFNERAGRAAGILFAFWPAQIMYSSVLASEHVFILFFILGIGLFIKCCREPLLQKNKMRPYIWPYAWPLITGAVLAMANFIRPVSLIIFPVLVIYLFIFADSGHTFKKMAAENTRVILLILSGFVVVSLLIYYPLAKLTDVPLWRSSSGFSFLMGTNYKYSGVYNKEDERIIYEFNYDFDRLHGEAARRAVDRIKSNPVQFARLAVKKFIIFWTSEDYGYYWSTVQLDKDDGTARFVKGNPGKFTAVSQFYYIIIIVFAAIGCLFICRNPTSFAVIFLLIFQGFAAMHIFLEVQSRYHYPVMPFLLLMAGYGIERLAMIRRPKQHGG